MQVSFNSFKEKNKMSEITVSLNYAKMWHKFRNFVAMNFPFIGHYDTRVISPDNLYFCHNRRFKQIVRVNILFLDTGKIYYNAKLILRSKNESDKVLVTLDPCVPNTEEFDDIEQHRHLELLYTSISSLYKFMNENGIRFCINNKHFIDGEN